MSIIYLKSIALKMWLWLQIMCIWRNPHGLVANMLDCDIVVVICICYKLKEYNLFIYKDNWKHITCLNHLLGVRPHVLSLLCIFSLFVPCFRAPLLSILRRILCIFAGRLPNNLPLSLGSCCYCCYIYLLNPSTTDRKQQRVNFLA